MTIGVIVFDEAEELDFVGPWEMLTMWNKYFGGPGCVVVAQRKAPVACAKGLSINPQHDFADCPPLDYLLVPGGSGTRREALNPAMTGFIAQRAPACRAVLSVCTGSFVLQAAGLLQGRRATTHWMALNELRALPGVQVCEERFVHDDRIWTAAGVSAGIDMTLAFIADQAGVETAGKVQAAAEYYPDGTRYGGFDRSERAPAYLRSC